jgi:hypothetical protein
MYFPWLSSLAASPATRVLLPASVVRAINIFMKMLIILPTPADSRSKSDLQAPGVMQLMITLGDDDLGS